MIEQKVLAFLARKNPNLKDTDFKNLPLFSQNTLDSMSFLELLSALEEDFNCEFDLSDYDPQDFDSIGKFCKILESLRQ